jgi:IS30 family transposase
MHYRHFSAKERLRLYALLQQGLRQRTIAKVLRRSRVSIYRELKRNRTGIEVKYNHSTKQRWHYLPDRAQKKYEGRRKESKGGYLKNDLKIYKYVLKKLKEGWSPEIIAGRGEVEEGLKVSHETIYRFIYSPQWKEMRLWDYLVRGHLRRRKKHGRKQKRTLIPNRRDIGLRPKEVDRREAFGHWEGDSVLGVGKGAALHTEVERVSRYLMMKKMDRKTSRETQRAMIELYRRFPQRAKQTTTLDNGSEFVDHEKVTQKTGIVIYFARPYHSWERGSNENANGMIRWYFPKKTDFNRISHKEIEYVQNLINNRPRKCLGFKTSQEIFNQLLSQCC